MQKIEDPTTIRVHHAFSSPGPVPVRPHGWRRGLSRARGFWRTFLRHPLGFIGLMAIIMFAVMALAHPVLMSTVWDRGTYHPLVGFDYDLVPHPTPPSWQHLLGTDSLGRDVLSQLLYATRTSFGIGLIAGLSATLLATLVGLFSAYYRGKLDTLLMVLSDAFVLMPAPVVLLVAGLVIDMTWLTVGLVYGLFAGLGSLAITLKSHALTLRVKPYVEAARVAGGGDWHIMRVHLLPGMFSLMLVNMMFAVSQSVLIEALLSFFGRTQLRSSWGTMIWFTQRTFRISAFGEQWHVVLPPALAIMAFSGAFYMIGRAFDSVINPRLYER